MSIELQEAAAAGFEDCERADLIRFCDALSVPYLPNNNAQTLRKRLKAALGDYQEQSVAEAGVEGAEETLTTAGRVEPPDTSPVASSPRTKTIPVDESGLTYAQLVALNLTPQGIWEGRRRLVTLHRAMEHESIAPQFFAWDQLHCYVPFGTGPHPLPYPIYNILLSTRDGKRMIQRRRTDEDGRVYYVEEWVSSQRFMFTDYGDDPVTAHLPTDIRDQYTRLWRLTNGFESFSKMQVRELCTRLRIPTWPDATVSDMKTLVAQSIGVVSDLLAAPAIAMMPRRSAGA